MKPKVGQPPRADTASTQRVVVRFTTEEKRRYQTAAGERGLSAVVRELLEQWYYARQVR